MDAHADQESVRTRAARQTRSLRIEKSPARRMGVWNCALGKATSRSAGNSARFEISMLP